MWEHCAERVPDRHFEALETHLLLERGCLASLALPAIAGRPAAPSPIRGLARPLLELPPYKCEGTLSQMVSIGWLAQRVLDRLEDAGYTPAQLAYIESRVPHDSPLELLVICWLLAEGFKLERLAPTQAGVWLPVLVDWSNPPHYAGYLVRDALVLREEKRTIVAFPQVWLPSTDKGPKHRLDFLVVYLWHDRLALPKGCGGLRGRSAGVYIDLEVDSQLHDEWRDEQRAKMVGLPRIGRRRERIVYKGFVRELLKEMHETLLGRVAKGHPFPWAA